MESNQINAGICIVLNELTNQKFRSIGKAADLLWITFGDDVIINNFKGEQIKKPKYAIHIQCSCYITKKGIEITEYNDLLNHKLKFHVIGVDFEECGNLKLNLTDDYQFLVLVNPNLKEEQWRFIKNDKISQHFIVGDCDS